MRVIIVLGLAFLLLAPFLFVLGLNETPHTVYLESPPNGTTTNLNNNSLNFTYNHTGSLGGIVNCTLYLEVNNTIKPVNLSTNVSADTSTTVYSNQSWDEGNHSWYVNCTNGTDTESSLDYYNGSFVFTYDNSSPIITNSSLDDALIFTNSSVRLNATVTDSFGVDTVKFLIETPYGQLNETATNGTGDEYYMICNSTGGTGNCSTNETGSYNWTQIWVNDTAGNINTSNLSLQFNVTNQTIFSINLNYPPSQTSTNNNTPRTNFTVSGSRDSYNCTLYFNNSTRGNTSALDNKETTITANPTTDGTYNWHVNCTYGNTTNQSEIREITIDTAKPTINFTSPTTQTGNHSQEWISANITASDPHLDTITIYLYNSTGKVQSNTSSNNTLFINFTSLAEGTYYLNATVNDTAGNENQTETRILTLDITSPSLSNISNSSITHDSATISWNTNELANSTVYYGNTTNTTSTQTSSSLTTSHSITLSSLSSSTTYYYNISSCDPAGNCNTSSQYNFTTPFCGNGVKETGEECDGSDFGGKTCSDYGYNSGSLSCTASCTINSENCYNSGGGGGGYTSTTTTNETNETTQEGCGNGICEVNESWESCPSDCAVEEASTEVSADLSLTEISQGENKTFSLLLTNNLGINQTAYLDSTGNISELIKFNNTNISIPASSSRNVKVNLLTTNQTKTGTYQGEILVKIGNKTHHLPLNLTVAPEKKPFVKASVETLSKQVSSNGTLKYFVEIYNLGREREVDLKLNYQIRTLENEILAEKTENLSLTTSTSFNKKWDLSNLNLSQGEYLITLKIEYGGLKTIAQDHFEVILVSWWSNTMDLIIVLIATVAITLGSIFLGIKFYQRRMLRKLRYLTPTNYKSLPQEDLYVGKIPVENKNAYLNQNDLMTHVLTAGSTGAGKTVSAMVIAEEVLKQKKPVVVFDPTGQWTGFVRPNRDNSMLSKYKDFGLNEMDVRSFPGMIHDVEDPDKKIDLKKYLNPGEITIFALDKLKPAEYDTAVRNLIDTIFQQDWEESGELKVLVIFDEVHRLLERYGGRGGYVYLEKAAREFRKWGLGIIMISQVLSDFKEALKGNVLTEIQMNTKATRDIDRAKEKYGEEYAMRITREEVGAGMVQNPKYNNGKPYWIKFRPLLHSPHKIPENELELYKKYSEELEEIEEKMKEKKRKGEDVFDMEIELKLAKNKLKGGKFRMAEIYITSLKNRLE